MTGVLVYSSSAGYIRELLTAARQVADGRPTLVLTLADGCTASEVGAAKVYECTQIISLCDAAAVAAAVTDAARQLDCDIVLLSADRRGKDLAGRVGQKLDAGVLTGVTALSTRDGRIVAERNALGGSVVEAAVLETPVKVFTIAPRSYSEAEIPGEPIVQNLELDTTPSGVQLVRRESKAHGSIDIAEASVLFAVGSGLDDRTLISDIERIAAKLGGAVGCSKPVSTDRQWFSEDRIIGISGKSCRPDLAVLLGISGQVQFWAGIRDARTIVAVNTDENAPIMGMSDYLLVGDVHDVIPQLHQALGA